MVGQEGLGNDRSYPGCQTATEFAVQVLPNSFPVDLSCLPGGGHGLR